MTHLPKNDHGVGLAIALVDMIFIGLYPVAAHYGVAAIDPLLFGGLVTLLGSVPLLIQLRVRGALTELGDRRFLRPLLAVAALTLVANILFFMGTSLTSGINTGLLVQIEPVYAIILAALFLGETIDALQLIATAIMISGAAVIAYRGTSALNPGDFLIVLVPVFYQLSHLVSKRLFARVGSVLVIPAARLFYGGLALTGIALAVHPAAAAQLASAKNWTLIVIVAFFFRFVDLSLWYQALKRLPLAKISALLPLSAATSFLGSLFFLHERAEPRHIVGFVLMVLGVALISWRVLRPRIA